MVASENEHLTETSSRRKDKTAGHMKAANPGARLGNMASSQGNLPLNQQQYATLGNKMNMFFPDPNSTRFERKKSNLDRQ